MNRGVIFLLAAAVAAPMLTLAYAKDERRSESLERGRHLVKIAGCNDCHTENYGLAAGQVPEAEWLKGSVVGWKGPWGTTYPINLRNFMSRMDEEQWLAFARTRQSRPPMPWFALHDMSDEELRDIYRFVRSLGAAGEEAPAYLPPGTEPPKPYFDFVLPPEPPAAK